MAKKTKSLNARAKSYRLNPSAVPATDPSGRPVPIPSTIIRGGNLVAPVPPGPAVAAVRMRLGGRSR
jgi:hypothetical protein